MYDQNLAEVYDLIYVDAIGKDYAAEAGELAELIRARRPAASSLLDVACGTGLHLRRFRELFDLVVGVELSPQMREIAVRRLGTGVTVHQGDMRTFGLARKFDAVTCLFSSIGYVQSREELHQALGRFAAHLEPAGVLIVEPWFSPQAWLAGTVHHSMVEEGGRTIMRLSYSGLTDDGHSLTDMHYLYGQEGLGVRHWRDEHIMSLFTDAEYREAFASAGFEDVRWVPGWRAGRDRIVGVLAGQPGV